MSEGPKYTHVPSTSKASGCTAVVPPVPVLAPPVPVLAPPVPAPFPPVPMPAPPVSPWPAVPPVPALLPLDLLQLQTPTLRLPTSTNILAKFAVLIKVLLAAGQNISISISSVPQRGPRSTVLLTGPRSTGLVSVPASASAPDSESQTPKLALPCGRKRVTLPDT